MKYAIVLCVLVAGAVLAEEVPNDKCIDIYDECVKETGEGPVARFKCGLKYLECRLGDEKVNIADLFDRENDKCTDVYDECVKATGEDPVSRFKCGIKYLECRLGGKMHFEGFEEILKSKIFDKENDKCIDVYDECVKETGEGPVARFKCGIKYLKCRLGGSLDIEDLTSFLPNDKCTDVYDECVKKTGEDPVSRFKCGIKYLECRLGRDTEGKDEIVVNCEKTKYTDCFKLSFGSMGKCLNEKVKCTEIMLKHQLKRKVFCMKKCKDDISECMQNEEKDICIETGATCLLECGE